MSRQPNRAKLTQEIGTETDTLTIARPFALEQDERRRYIRLEISSPMELRKIRDIGGQYWPTGERRVIDGLILNISANGVLVETSQPINEGDVVTMRFTLQDVEHIEHVLGLAKRVDADSDGYLVGIEFVTREDLGDLFSKEELTQLSGQLIAFDESVRRVLNKYLRKEEASNNGNDHKAF
ncbi:MAG: PilZ domain-containing protein [candidate division Zixibacteria bacterium]|nr:PilZ domain-containing protein [candidate division Zixibacteria bacterium]